MFHRRVPHKSLLGAVVALTAALFSGIATASNVQAPSDIQKAGKVVYCSELAYAPWEMLDPETQQPTGFDIELGKALAKGMGQDAEFKNIAFDGLIPALQAGQCNAIISGLADKPERRKVVDFVDYAIAGNAIIVRSESKHSFSSLQDLSGLKVSVAVGSALEDELNKDSKTLQAAGKPEIKVIALQSGTDAFQQLVAGLADAYFGSTDQAGYFNTQKPGLLKLASPQMFTLTVGVATLKKDSTLHDAFNAAFEQIKSSGEYTAIAKKWGLEALTIH